MYRIKTKDGRTILTEKPIYIRRHSAPGVYLMCKPEKAEGVAHHGTPYFFDEGNSIQEFDGADELRNLRAVQMTQEETNAAMENALCEQDAAMDERMSALEDAVCELDAAING